MSSEGRKNTKRYETDELQGAGSWIETRLALLGESKAFFKETERIKKAAGDVEPDSEESAELEAAALKLGQDWYAKNVVAWNWKGEDGNILPIPSVDPTVLDLLNSPEMTFVAAAINGSAQDQKKRPNR